MKRLLINILFWCLCGTVSVAQGFRQEYGDARKTFVETIATPDHADSRYGLGQPAALRVVAREGGVPLEGTTIYYKVGPEMFLPEHYDSTAFVGGEALLQMGTMQEPGFLACQYEFRAGGKTYKDLVKVAYEPEQIKTLCECYNDKTTDIATLGIKFKTLDAVKNPNSPKIILDNKGFAMYFSRSVIPFIRGKEETEWLQSFNFLKHIGMYAYRRMILKEVTALPQSSLEIAESLEQLRWLQNGYKIKVGETTQETIGIDTPEDLEAAIKRLNTEHIS